MQKSFQERESDYSGIKRRVRFTTAKLGEREKRETRKRNPPVFPVQSSFGINNHSRFSFFFLLLFAYDILTMGNYIRLEQSSHSMHVRFVLSLFDG